MGTAYVVQKYSESLEFSISWRMKIQGNFRKYQEYFEFSKELSCKSKTGLTGPVIFKQKIKKEIKITSWLPLKINRVLQRQDQDYQSNPKSIE